MRVAWFPKSMDLAGNPYWPRLQQELEALGVEFETSHSSNGIGRRWLWHNRRRVGILHFHYVQQFYAYEGTQARLRWVLRFARNLLLARAWGYRTVFTLHNLAPTYPLQPRWVDHWGHWVAANLTDCVIVHCRYARAALARRFRRRRDVQIIPHPHFVGIYPDDLPVGEARARLCLSADETAFVFLGGIRPNKGLETLCTAFRSLPGSNLHLIIAGKPWSPPGYVEQLKQLAEDDGRIRLIPRFVPDSEIQLYLKAADVVVLPFASILTSSSAILAMSFGRPLVVPAMGCLPELVAPDAGILYDANVTGSLREALERCGQLDLQKMGQNALAKVSEFSWASFASQTVAAYGLG